MYLSINNILQRKKTKQKKKSNWVSNTTLKIKVSKHTLSTSKTRSCLACVCKQNFVHSSRENFYKLGK